MVSARPATQRLAANGKLKLAKPSWYTAFEIMLTRPPPISCGVAKALNVQAKAVVTPATTPGIDNGRVMVRKVRIGPAPRLSAALSRSRSICDRPAASMITMTGMVTWTRATTTPKVVNMNWMGWSIRPRPRNTELMKPLLPSTMIQE